MRNHIPEPSGPRDVAVDCSGRRRHHTAREEISLRERRHSQTSVGYDDFDREGPDPGVATIKPAGQSQFP